MTLPHLGHCLCGAVHYSIDAEPLGARTCWCRDCQYIASGSGTNNVLVPEQAVRIEGDLGTYRMTADSGNTVERGFCKSCGSQIYSRTVEPAGLPMRIRSGTLDNHELRAPEAIIWTDSAPGWAVLDARLPQYPKGPK